LKLLCALLITGLFTASAGATPSLRGMSSQDDFRLGPILQGGIALGIEVPGDRQFYQLELRGENPEYGFSRIFLRNISLFRILELPSLSNSSTIERRLRFHHQFFTLGFESPMWHQETRPYNLDWGWIAGFTLARATFKEPNRAANQTGIEALFADYPEVIPTTVAQERRDPTSPETQFLGGEFGSYLRWYGLHPVVPYTSFRLNLGSFFDYNAFVNGEVQTPRPDLNNPTPVPTPSTPPQKQRYYKSSLRAGMGASAGIDVYIGSRGVLGLEYTLWNWDFGMAQDWSQFLAIKAGFLF